MMVFSKSLNMQQTMKLYKKLIVTDGLHFLCAACVSQRDVIDRNVVKFRSLRKSNYSRGSQHFSCLIEHSLIKTIVSSTRSEQQTSQSVISTLNLNHKQPASSRVTLNSGYTGSVSVRQCLSAWNTSSSSLSLDCKLRPMQTAHSETQIVNIPAKILCNAAAGGYGYKITLHLEYGTSNQLTFGHRASSVQDRRFAAHQRTFFIYLINKYISLSDNCLTVHH